MLRRAALVMGGIVESSAVRMGETALVLEGRPAAPAVVIWVARGWDKIIKAASLIGETGLGSEGGFTASVVLRRAAVLRGTAILRRAASGLAKVSEPCALIREASLVRTVRPMVSVVMGLAVLGWDKIAESSALKSYSLESSALLLDEGVVSTLVMRKAVCRGKRSTEFLAAVC